MKILNNHISKKLTLIAVVLSMTSCEKYLDDAFLNPNAPTVVSPEEALAPIAANMARGIQFDARISGSFVQYLARTGAGDSWERHGYLPNSDTGGELWRMHYFALGQNLNNIIRDAKAQGKEEFAAVAFAVFAWSWLNLTDYHGEVILKQAFDTSRLTFDYDSQEDTYKHVAAMCDSANRYLDIAAKKTPSPGFATADAYLYGGDLTKWRKFVSGVQAKLLHRYSLKSTYKPDDVIKAVDAAFVSVDDEAMVTFKNSAATSEESNFFGARRNNLGNFRQTDYFVKLLDGSILPQRDPRLGFLLKPSDDRVFRGILPNQGEATTLPVARRTYNFFGTIATVAPVLPFDQDVNSRSYFKNNAPFPIMTLAELQFIKAEAAFRKGDRTTALDAYKKGIKANFDMLKKYFTGYENFTDKQVTDYINAPTISPASAADLTLSQIMLQKFIALWGYGYMETWVDMRRFQYNPAIYTGFTLPNTLYPDNAGKLVQRVRPRYNSEYLWNVDALRKVGGLNPDYHTVECWFSKP